MIFTIPVIGWIIGSVFFLSLSVPFWWFWNDLAPIYFYWLPSVYLNIPFWNIFGLFVCISILKFALVPKFTYPPTFQTKK